MKHFLLLFFTCLVLFTSKGYSQSYAAKENYNWFWGIASINFNQNPPAVTATSAMNYNTWAAASVCDANGHLLFYTDGDYVYDRNNNLMPNGQDVIGLAGNNNYFPTENSRHGAQIIPVRAR